MGFGICTQGGGIRMQVFECVSHAWMPTSEQNVSPGKDLTADTHQQLLPECLNVSKALDKVETPTKWNPHLWDMLRQENQTTQIKIKWHFRGERGWIRGGGDTRIIYAQGRLSHIFITEVVNGGCLWETRRRVFWIYLYGCILLDLWYSATLLLIFPREIRNTFTTKTTVTFFFISKI